MSTIDRTSSTDASVRRHHDDRAFYRTALAVVAPLPMLAQGLTYFLSESVGASELPTVSGEEARLLGALLWLQPLFYAFLIPAVIAVAVTSRGRSPRLTAWGVVLTVPGIGLGLGSTPNDTVLAYLARTADLDVETVRSLDEAWWEVPSATLGSLFFLVAIVVGLLLLGIALARSGRVPAAYGVALAVGGFTHPFLAPLGHQVVGLGLFVAAAGFAGASWALLRMSDDDLAPSPR